VTKALSGDTYYVDFDRLKIHDGNAYYWQLTDYLKPGGDGDLSSKYYYQGDCKRRRYRDLSSFFYLEPMGEGKPMTTQVNKHAKWSKPSPNYPSSSDEITLNAVCKFMKKKGYSKLKNKFPLLQSPSSEKKLSPTESRQKLLDIMNRYAPSDQ
jgi:hypothetical protein